jgi:hypothetical protein
MNATSFVETNDSSFALSIAPHSHGLSPLHSVLLLTVMNLVFCHGVSGASEGT